MSAPHADDRPPHRPDRPDRPGSGPPPPDGRPRNGYRPADLLDRAAVPPPRRPGDGGAAPGAAVPGPGAAGAGPAPGPAAGPHGTVPAPRPPWLPGAAAPAAPLAAGAVPAGEPGDGPPAWGGPPPGVARPAAPGAPWAGPAPTPGPWSTASWGPAAPVPRGAATAPPAGGGHPASWGAPGHTAPQARPPSGPGAGAWAAVAVRAGGAGDRISRAVTGLDGALGRALPGGAGHRGAALAVGATLLLAVAAAAGAESPGADNGPAPGTAAPAAQEPVPAPADLVAGTAPADPAAFAGSGFRSPSGNITCRIDGAETRCDTRTRAWSPPDDPACTFRSGTGLVLRAAGAGPSCGGERVRARGTAELGYGTHLTRGDVTCVSRRTGVECRDARTGHGFATSREAYRIY
ncbi:hypothetical protein WHI96_11420 [Pseudonocardia tropica]|uniref:Uncharacterized protein n=1 Tax=Pseudonocardia tropica TaxID=681289 RepID=A0ABV1JU09_9PSEU